MKFINNTLAADNNAILKFKNDLGHYVDRTYVGPAFFLSCFPAKSINSIKKAQEIFEEVKLSEKEAHIAACKIKFESENPLPVIEEVEVQEEIIEEEE